MVHFQNLCNRTVVKSSNSVTIALIEKHMERPRNINTVIWFRSPLKRKIIRNCEERFHQGTSYPFMNLC